METKDLNVLIKALELGSLSKASVDLGYSPSAGSHIIERLEEQLGVPLLKRSHSGVTPTEDCEMLLPSIRSILEQQTQIQSLADRLKSRMSGQLNIGSISSVVAGWLPEICDSFLQQFPGVNITTYEGGYPELERWLQEDAVDCAFLSASTSGPFTYLPLRSDPFHVVFPTGHPLSAKDSVHPLELRNYDVITQTEGLSYDAPTLLQMIPNRYPKLHAAHLREISVLSMVRMNRGIAILPELLVKNAASRGIDSRPFSTGEQRTICLALHKANGTVPDPILQHFIDHVMAWATKA